MRASASPSASAVSTSVPGWVRCVTVTDRVLGIRFPAPGSFPYVAAVLAQSFLALTDTARLSSYGLDGPRPSDLSRELLVEMFLVERRGDDLRTIADRRFSYLAIERRDVVVAGHPALRLDGEFQNGRRVYVLVQVDDQRVLVIGAFPSDSSRLGDFDRLLQYLVIG